MSLFVLVNDQFEWVKQTLELICPEATLAIDTASGHVTNALAVNSDPGARIVNSLIVSSKPAITIAAVPPEHEAEPGSSVERGGGGLFGPGTSVGTGATAFVDYTDCWGATRVCFNAGGQPIPDPPHVILVHELAHAQDYANRPSLYRTKSDWAKQKTAIKKENEYRRTRPSVPGYEAVGPGLGTRHTGDVGKEGPGGPGTTLTPRLPRPLELLNFGMPNKKVSGFGPEPNVISNQLLIIPGELLEQDQATNVSIDNRIYSVTVVNGLPDGLKFEWIKLIYWKVADPNAPAAVIEITGPIGTNMPTFFALGPCLELLGYQILVEVENGDQLSWPGGEAGEQYIAPAEVAIVKPGDIDPCADFWTFDGALLTDPLTLIVQNTTLLTFDFLLCWVTVEGDNLYALAEDVASGETFSGELGQCDQIVEFTVFMIVPIGAYVDEDGYIEVRSDQIVSHLGPIAVTHCTPEIGINSDLELYLVS